MNTFTIEKYGDTQYQLQCANESGFGTHIICTADELAQLRELLAPMAWQGNGRDDLFDVTVTGNLMAAVGFKHYVENFGEFGGLWLKLPDVPEVK